VSTSVSQVAIAKALGVTQPAIARHARRGMPTDNLASAAAWYHRNVRPQRPRASRTRKAETPAPTTPAAIASAATATSSLDELRELRDVARRGLADAQAAGDDYATRAWALARSRILDQTSVAEERLLAVARARGELLSVQESREIFGSVLMDVRKLLDAAPGALAAKVNPCDVDHARAVLDEWLRATLRTLHREPITNAKND
jgi:hypothetical protein